MHFLRFGKRRAFDRRVRRILPRRKLRRVFVYMKLAIATSRWWRRHWHPRLSVPFAEFISGLRHVISSVLGIQSNSFLVTKI
jgi:membrane protein DedA with SNARE-associated domain